jgi:16S rRNA processing protein RimM
VAAGTEMLIVGRVAAPFGVKGWVHITSFTDPTENLEHYRPWQLHRQGRWQAVELAAIKAHKKGFVARFAGVADRDAAASLNGCEVGIDPAVLPTPGPEEYYWKDLIGLRAERPDGTILGSVKGLLATGAHDVLVVDHAGGEVLIPFVAAIIAEVDLDRGRLVANWDPED